MFKARAFLWERFRALEHTIDLTLRHGNIYTGTITVPGEIEYIDLFKAFIKESFVQGMILSIEEIELKRKQQAYRQVKFEESQKKDINIQSGFIPVVPEDAISFLKGRTALQGKWNRDLDADVTKVLVQGLETGATTKETMGALRGIFKDYSDIRLENIARTESTAAFNQGRLNVFRQQADFIPALQFCAILDARTTDICRARNGLIMKIGDPRIAENTPPLHFMCRSIWSPVTIHEWEELQNGEPRALRNAFGFLEKDENGLFHPPTTLQEALDGWDKKEVPKPLKGFGKVEDIKKKPVKAKTEKPAKKEAEKKEKAKKPEKESKPTKEKQVKEKPVKPDKPVKEKAVKAVKETPVKAEKPLKEKAKDGIIEEKGIDVWIDELTPCLKERETEHIYDTEYHQIKNRKEIEKIEAKFKASFEKYKDRYEEKEVKERFDWVKQWDEKENNSEFYKLILKGQRETQGIIETRLHQNSVEMKLMETAPHNFGGKGKYIGVGGHLAAIAIKRSIETKGEGYIFFKAKTKLIEHYKKVLGAKVYQGDRMHIYPAEAIILYNKYFGDKR